MSRGKTKKKLEKEKRKKKIRFLVGGAILIVFLVVSGIFVAKKIQSNTIVRKYATEITKEEVRSKVLGFQPVIQNPRVLADAYRFSDSFAAEDLTEEDGTKVGSEAIIMLDNPSYQTNKELIPANAALLLIVDNDLNILSLAPFKPTYFDLTIDFDKYFEEYKGKKAEVIIKQDDGIYTGESNTALIIKNKVREALSLFYIEKNGVQQYEALGASGYVFSERGAKVEPIEFTDAKSIKYNLANMKNYKLVIIGGNPGCGSCVEHVGSLGKIFSEYDLSNVKFIVLSFSEKVEDLEKLTKELPGEVIGVIDSNRDIAIKLRVNSSPYIALVDRELTLFYRGPAEPMKETLNNIKEFMNK